MPPPGPACATCRQKCRKCDRAQPVCNRCKSKGLKCGGYPPKFKFCGLASRGKWKGMKEPRSKAVIEEATASPPEMMQLTDRISGIPSPDSQGPIVQSPDLRSPDATPQALWSTEIDNIEALTEPVLSPMSEYMSSTSSVDREGDNGLAMAEMEETFSSTQCSPAATEELLASDNTELLLSYFDENICPLIAVPQSGIANPFKEHVLPLAYENSGLLHAVLGLSACHLSNAKPDPYFATKALEHRLDAIHYLGELLAEERNRQLNKLRRDVALAIINILVLHDICESGISSHGVHLSGATYLCDQIMSNYDSIQGRRTVFLLGSLAWLDLLRGISGAEKLTFSQEHRQKIVDSSGPEFEIMCGCPKDLFIILGDVIAHGKKHFTKELTTESFNRFLAMKERELLIWNERRDIYPSYDHAWQLLADCFRHTAILRILRFPDTFERPADFPEIQHSVTSILDAAAQVPSTSPLSKRLLLPLFMAGADSMSKHQRHYILMRIQEIQRQTKFSITAPSLLQQVWDARDCQKPGDKQNIPWMEYTCSKHLERQHDYLIF